VKTGSTCQRRRPSRKAVPQPVEQFVGPPLTRYGGAGLLRRWVERVGLVERLEQLGLPWSGRRYEGWEYLHALVMGQLVGLQRQTELAQLRHDRAGLMALGLWGMPSQPSWSRFLSSGMGRVAQQVWRMNREWVRQRRRGWRSATLDLDLEVISTRGHPEGANRGYNPKRRDSKSYVALRGFVGETRDLVTARLRPGREATISAKAAKRTFREARAGLPQGLRRLRVRADAGFYSEAFLAELEAHGALYFVAVPAWRSLQRRVGGVRFRRLDRKWAIGELTYEASGSKRRYRMVVIRERLDPTEPRKKQLALLDCPRYAYQIIATNSTWAPQDVWHFYNRRCCVENLIKENQGDFGGNHILSHTYGGNALWLALSGLAYNLWNWFREKVLRQRAHRQTARSLRRLLIELPGELVYSGRQYGLNLGRGHPVERLFLRARERIAAAVL